MKYILFCMRDRINRLVEWYKYVLKFHPVKYFGIFVMLCGPLFVIYRFVFFNSHISELIIGVLGFFVLGSFIWSLGWDPYA